MNETKSTWGEYSKLILNEIERLTDNDEKTNNHLNIKFKEIDDKINKLEQLEKTVLDHKNWIKEVNNVWPPIQMKEGKDQIYKQKDKWVSAIAILAFIQILLSLSLALWSHFKK